MPKPRATSEAGLHRAELYQDNLQKDQPDLGTYSKSFKYFDPLL